MSKEVHTSALHLGFWLFNYSKIVNISVQKHILKPGYTGMMIKMEEDKVSTEVE